MKKRILFIMLLLFLSSISLDEFQNIPLNCFRRLRADGNINFYQIVQNILMDLEGRITNVDKVVVFDELRYGVHGGISWKTLQICLLMKIK
ncbi:MAG: hypothetical protein P9X27_04465 [Candidatus Kaelpia aquatica]|nr:hypothetical protein [Candidatus Kaelpia aquatica]